MIKTILLVESYVPGSASSNRMICYAKGYRGIGLNVKLLLQTVDDIEMPDIPGVSVIRVKDGLGSNRLMRIINRLRSMIGAIKREYIKGESVIQVYNVPLFIRFINKRKYNVFCEIGEIPYYAEIKSFVYRIKESLRLSGTKRIKGLIVLTNALKDYFAEKGVENIVVSNVIVDKERFNASGQLPQSTYHYIAYCGTVSKHKDGVDDLIKAFKIVNENHPDYYLDIIGGFTSAYQDEEYLKLLVKELGIEDKIHFTGKVSPEEMPRRLRAADILALARPDNIQAKYGFPTKVGEYLCAGKPIVITKVGELDRLLTDKVDCVFAKPDNHEDFASKLLWVIEHPEEAQSISEQGLKLVDDVFSPVSQARNVLAFMQGVLES